MAGRTLLDKALRSPRSLGEARMIVIRERFGTVSAAARRLEADIGLLSKVIRSKKRSRPLERRLARALRMRLLDLFPEWYGNERRAA